MSDEVSTGTQVKDHVYLSARFGIPESDSTNEAELFLREGHRERSFEKNVGIMACYNVMICECFFDNIN